MSVRRLSLSLAALMAIAAPVSAVQDNHYWDRAYGTTSELLGGTAIGDVRDLSATFYNPGAFALADDPPLPEESLDPRVRFWRLKLILGFTTGRSR